MKKTILIAIFFGTTYTNILAQCFLDRHNTTWFDQWISCTTSVNPNPARSQSHWILYNLNYSYKLFQLHIWNANAPDYLTAGMQDIFIDVSNDGVNWTEIGEFKIPMADGTPTYEGLGLYDFDGINAQYILITGLTNYGGSCFGLSEIRINVDEEVTVGLDEEPVQGSCLSARIFPNPIKETSKAIISSYCSNAPIFYSLQDISGKTIKTGEITLVGNEVELNLNALSVVSGSYVLSLRQLDLVKRYKIVKVE